MFVVFQQITQYVRRLRYKVPLSGINHNTATSGLYRRINSTTSPSLVAGNVTESRLITRVARVCAKSCARRSVCAIREMEVPLLVCLRSSCSHVIDEGAQRV